MHRPLVSIIIPTYNRAYILGPTLDSVLAQTYENYEALVIDDGSTDNTAQLVADYSRLNPRIKYFRQDNAGVSAARNHGMGLAQGDYLAFLDSDDIWKPWKLALQVDLLEKLPECIMLWTDMETIDEQGNFIEQRYLRKMYSAYKNQPDVFPFDNQSPLKDLLSNVPLGVPFETRVSHGNIFHPMLKGNLVHTSTVLFRRCRLTAAELFSEKFRHAGEDYHFHLHTCKLASVAYLDCSTIEYRLGLEDRITHPRNNLRFSLAYLETVKPFLDDVSVSSSMRAEILHESYQWIGEQYLENNDHFRAFKYFTANLSSPAYVKNSIKNLIKCALPIHALRKVLALYQF
jgi:glycosyltransferase involved in cell wall biosynthesis